MNHVSVIGAGRIGASLGAALANKGFAIKALSSAKESHHIIGKAIFLLKKMGFNEKIALKILLPLIQGTLQNVKEFKLEPSLTGLIIRGNQ